MIPPTCVWQAYISIQFHLRLPLRLLDAESPALDEPSKLPRSWAELPVFPPPRGSSRLRRDWSRPISLMSNSRGSSSASYVPAVRVKLYLPPLSLVALPLAPPTKLEYDPVWGGVTPRPPVRPKRGRYGEFIDPTDRPLGICGASASFPSSDDEACRDMAADDSVICGAGCSNRDGDGDEVDATLSVVCPILSKALKLGGSRSSAPRLMLL